jgi:BirA family biotin operon repressor/biotin-[acetyl-CoA-carboxylase] ligase
MITDGELIGFLSDGEFHSGEEIGLQLGVSRTAIWKRLKKLSSLGLKVDSIKGCGYRLSQKLELLDKGLIESYLSGNIKAAINDLYIESVTDSTNNYLLERPKDNQTPSAANICLAEHQSGGRGRRGRQWMSPYGSNLYLSLDWQFEGGIAALEGLSLAVGVVVVRSLSALGIVGVSLKWPNDILIDGAKLGGILIDVKGDHAGPCRIVVGVGVNINMSRQDVDIDQSWIDLKSICADISRNKLAAYMIDELIKLLASYEMKGFQPYVAEWQRLDAFNGKLVDVISGEQKISGICCGIANNGALIIDIDGVKKRMHGGELSLRLSNES